MLFCLDNIKTEAEVTDGGLGEDYQQMWTELEQHISSIQVCLFVRPRICVNLTDLVIYLSSCNKTHCVVKYQ